MRIPSLVSFISPVCNQGDEARLTVESAISALGDLPHEIILVDDNSIDGSCHGLPKDVLIVRTERREGVSSARRLGYAQSRGDVLIWSDPHCRFPPESLKRLAILAANQDAIFQPRIAPTKQARVRCGGMLAISTRGLRIQRVFRHPHSFPALYGTVYAMPRKTYDHVGGWPRLPGVWSYSEQALTLMAWFLGIPIVVDTQYVCIHKAYQENRRFPFSVHNSDISSNAHFVHAAIFPQTYSVFWRQMLERHFRGKCDLRKLAHSQDFKQLQCRLQQHSVRTEVDFFHQVLKRDCPPFNGTMTSSATPSVDASSLEAYIQQQSQRSKPQEYLTMRPRVDAALKWMASVLANEHLLGRKALDAGTRDGYATIALSSLGLSSVEGIELVPEVARFAHAQGRPVRCGDIRNLTHSDASLDLITCIHALEHVPNPDAALREFARVLRRDGWLYIVVPSELAQHRQNDPTHNYTFASVDEVLHLLARVGLYKPESARTDVGVLAKGHREFRVLIQPK